VTRKGGSSPIAEKLYERAGNLAVVENLTPFVNYSLTVFATTDKGWGQPSEFTAQTSEAGRYSIYSLSRETRVNQTTFFTNF